MQTLGLQITTNIKYSVTVGQGFMLFTISIFSIYINFQICSSAYIPCDANGTDDFLGGGAGGFLPVGLGFLGTVIDE